MLPFGADRYLARKKIFNFLGQAFHIFGADGQLHFYVKQKAFRLKEAITVYADEAKTREVLHIQARSRIDFSGVYDVLTPQDQKLGSLKREGFRSMLRDEWSILDVQGRTIGTIQEDSMLLAVLRRFLSNLVPQTFDIVVDGVQVGEFKQHFNPFVAKFDIDFSMDHDQRLDRRMGIAAVILLLAIEGRQEGG